MNPYRDITLIDIALGLLCVALVTGTLTITINILRWVL